MKQYNIRRGLKPRKNHQRTRTGQNKLTTSGQKPEETAFWGKPRKEKREDINT